MSFADIVKHGRYYYPANQRYGADKTVVCDRCKRRDIPVCIGYEDLDLCLPCAEQVSVIMKRKELIAYPPSNPFERITTKMVTDRFEPPRTLMATDRFRGDTMTYMASDRFREQINYDNVIGWKSPYEEEINEHPKLIERPAKSRIYAGPSTDMMRDRFGK